MKADGGYVSTNARIVSGFPWAPERIHIYWAYLSTFDF